jgi:hypothetical protein
MPTSLIQFSAGQRTTSGAVSTERNEDGGTAFSLASAASSLGAGLCGAEGFGGGLTEGATGAGLVSGAAADGLVDGAGGFRAGVSAKAGGTEKEKSKIISRMLKKVANYTRPSQVGQDPLLPEARSQVKSIPQTYRHSTRAALSRPRPALSHRYVEDGLAPRTKLGTVFSILPSTLLLTFQISRSEEIIGHHLSGV